MKYLGVDFGTKKIGIAISDEAGEFAFPKEIIAPKDTLSIIEKIVKEEGVVAIVIGESIATNQEKNDLAARATAFANAVARKTGLPVSFEREDFSSVEAHRYQTSAGSRDDSAAAIILQRFLDKKRSS